MLRVRARALIGLPVQRWVGAQVCATRSPPPLLLPAGRGVWGVRRSHTQRGKGREEGGNTQTKDQRRRQVSLAFRNVWRLFLGGGSSIPPRPTHTPRHPSSSLLFPLCRDAVGRGHAWPPWPCGACGSFLLPPKEAGGRRKTCFFHASSSRPFFGRGARHGTKNNTAGRGGWGK